MSRPAAAAPPTKRPRLAGQPSTAPAIVVSHVSWAHEYAPQRAEDLVIHKKKVEELRGWLGEAAARCGRPAAGCLLLTGPPGCGKSTLVRVLAAEAGLRLSEWTPPSGATWEEHQHAGGAAGQPYRSKLDEFEDFVGRSTLFPALALQRSRTAAPCGKAGAVPPEQEEGTKLLLIDDLPHAAGPSQRSRVACSLGRLAAASRFPTVVITTTGDSAASSERFSSAALGSHHGLHKELLVEMEASGVRVLSLNPVTINNAAKALKLIGAAMGVSLTDESAVALAEAASGNLHNAIECLQLHLLGHARLGAKPLPKTARPSKNARGRKKAPAGAQVSLPGAAGGAGGGAARMDTGLSLFHALGKLLHGKRLPPDGGAHAEERDGAAGAAAAGWMSLPALRGAGVPAAEPLPPLPVSQHLRRPPSASDPEATLGRAQLDADSVSAFLQENMCDFIAEERIEDAAACADYLSHAQLLGAQQRTRPSMGYLTDAGPFDVASSVAARGVMWANSSPLSRWQPLRGPGLWAAEKATRFNAEQLAGMALAGGSGNAALASCSPQLAAEVLPFLRCLRGSAEHADLLAAALPRRWMCLRHGQAVLDEAARPPTGAAGARDIGVEGPSGEKEEEEEEDAIEEG